jgi:hypothetical protein
VRRPGETDKSWREGGGITCADSDLLVYSLLTLASVPSDRSKYEYAGQPASLWVQNEAICKPTRIKTPEKHFARQNPHILMDHSAQPLSQAHPYWPRPSVPDAGPYSIFVCPPVLQKGSSQRVSAARERGDRVGFLLLGLDPLSTHVPRLTGQLVLVGSK